MRKEDPGRRFSREFKIAAVQRMAAGAKVSKLAKLKAFGSPTRPRAVVQMAIQRHRQRGLAGGCVLH